MDLHPIAASTIPIPALLPPSYLLPVCISPSNEYLPSSPQPTRTSSKSIRSTPHNDPFWQSDACAHGK